MDRKIKKSKSRKAAGLLVKSLIFILMIMFFFYMASSNTNEKKYRVASQQITVAQVEEGEYEDYLQIKATVEPKKTVYIDITEGGRVDKKFVDEGVYVEEGQKLIKLSNNALLLSVITREAQITEQLNNLQNTKLAMAQDSLDLQSMQIEYEYQISKLARTEENQRYLFKEKLISEDTYADTFDELEYFKSKLAVTLKRQKQTNALRKIQMTQLEDSTQRLVKNLDFTRNSIKELIIKAPSSGYLTSLDVELGASLQRGQRVAQLDDINEFKLSAQVDEYYLNKIRTGQKASFELSGKIYNLLLSKIYLKVQNGKFKVDLLFNSNKPKTLHRGQSLQLKLHIYSKQSALLLPLGPYFEQSRGQWVFVVDPDGGSASRRNIKFNRKNPKYLEVISGLKKGEKVITSNYSQLDKFDTLTIEN